MTSLSATESTKSYVSVADSQTLWLALIIVLGAALRLYGLDFQSLWHDEGLQFYVAVQHSFSELLHQTRSFHPPLSFMINRFFLLFGESDFWLRLPSALFGIACLPVLYILGRELTSRRDAVLAVFVMALSPFHIWYSQEGRMYSQLLFLSLLSSVLLLQAMKRGKVSRWIFYVLVSAAGMYTHVFMGLALAVQLLWVVFYHRQRLMPLIGSGFAVALIFLPWAVFLPWLTGFARAVTAHGLVLGSASGGRAGFTWAALPYTLFGYGAGFSLGPSVAELHANKSVEFILTFLPSITLVMSVFMVLLVIGMWAIYKCFGARAAMFYCLGLFVPLIGTAVYSLTPRGTFNLRYTVIAFPYFCLLVGTALAFITRASRTFGSAALVAVMGVSGASLYNYFTNPHYAKEDIRSAVAFWREAGNDEPLLAVGSVYPAYRYVRSAVAVWREGAKDEPLIAFGSVFPGHRYVGTSGTKRLFLLDTSSQDITRRIEHVFLRENILSAYVVLSRDWNKTGEAAVRNAFAGRLERSFPGDVKVFRISRPETLEFVATAVIPAASGHP